VSTLRNYSAGTRAALQTLNRGTCYYPMCREPVVKRIEGADPIEYSINYEIAHIRAAREGGPRHDRSMSDAERISVQNLILLCKPHHTYVDKRHPDKYPPETLLAWKAEREADAQDALAGLSGLTEDSLQDIITEAFEAREDKVMETLARLEANDAEAAKVMREILDELDHLRTSDSYLDSDIVSMLHDASTNLRNLPDSAELLGDATERLNRLPDHAETLSAAAYDLGNLQQHASALNSAAEQLSSLPGQINLLSDLVHRLESMEGWWDQ
jgi:hypothetical protein